MMLARYRSGLFVRAFSTAALVLSILFVAMYLLSVPFIQRTVESIEKRNARTVLDHVFELAEEIQRNQDNVAHILLVARKQELRSIIEVVVSRAAMLEQKVRDGQLAKTAARQLLLDEVRKIKYGRDDYVSAIDYRSVLIAHPDPKLDGADFSQRLDIRGSPIIPPMVQGALLQGEGYHAYWWRRLGENQPIEKITFYRNVPFFDLLLVTGVYVDDIDAVLENKRTMAIESLREQILETRLAKTGYLYIFDSNKVLIHPNPTIEGKPLSEIIDPVSGRPITDQLKQVADKAEGLHYFWDRPDDPRNYTHAKISWVRYLPDLDWYICSSVYLEELNASATTLSNRMLMIFAATLLLVLGLVYLFIKRMVDPLHRLSEVARSVSAGDYGTRSHIVREDEIGVVAKAFDGMVAQLHDHIQNLDAKVSERTADLEAANAELKVLDQMKSDFLSTVSHELRTPMTSIVGFAKLMKKKLDETIFPNVIPNEKTTRAITQVSSNIDIVVKESQRLTLLINDVLDSAKLEAGSIEWQFAAHAPRHIIELAMSVTAPLAEQKNLRLVWQGAGDLPLVRCDSTRIHQVLINLISNAIKFSTQGEITLEATHTEGVVCFSVRDNGIGIPTADMEKVFDKFKQIGDTLTDKPQGTGLGLSICRQIINSHGGRIWAESTFGEGSTFFFTLPTEPLAET